MRDNSKRIAVVLAGTAVAAVATSLAAPAAEATTHAAAPATVVRGGGSHDWDNNSGRHNGHQQYGQDHQRDWNRGHEHGGHEHGGQHGWHDRGNGHGHNWGGGGYRVVGHYRSYRDCWDAGSWGRGHRRWHSYDCYQSGGGWVLHVS
jgi:hypothetical protein